jgi:hypothetical protein
MKTAVILISLRNAGAQRIRHPDDEFPHPREKMTLRGDASGGFRRRLARFGRGIEITPETPSQPGIECLTVPEPGDVFMFHMMADMNVTSVWFFNNAKIWQLRCPHA